MIQYDKTRQYEDDEELQQYRKYKFQITQAFQVSLEKIISYPEQIDSDFDIEIDLLLKLNSYNSAVFKIEANMNPDFLHCFIVCPPNIDIQVAYALNIWNKSIRYSKNTDRKIL